MDRVGLLVHPTRPVVDGIEILQRWTAERDLDLVQVPAGRQPSVAPAGQASTCDLIVALGGDGTILKALHAAANTRTPVLGVAYGSLGALTSVPTSELSSGLRRFASGDWTARQLPALALEAQGAQLASAINDVVIARGRGTQLSLDVSVDGELYVRMAGDGVVLATPLGSSAYSMASGGSLLAEASHAYLCTPLAMHGGCAPPVVVPAEAEVTVELHPGHSGFYVDVDGFAVETDSQRFAVRCGPAYATLVAFGDSPSSLTRLRSRTLISDSPRLAGREERAQRAEIEALP